MVEKQIAGLNGIRCVLVKDGNKRDIKIKITLVDHLELKKIINKNIFNTKYFKQKTNNYNIFLKIKYDVYINPSNLL